jgi:hypothetical protein
MTRTPPRPVTSADLGKLKRESLPVNFLFFTGNRLRRLIGSAYGCPRKEGRGRGLA